MSEILWRLAARVLSKPSVVKFLIKRALPNPYHHLASPDGQELYMARYWLLNPYDRATQKVKHRWLPWSVRLHFIYREDQDRDLHDHPWNARTIILQGGYEEQRLIPMSDPAAQQLLDNLLSVGTPVNPDKVQATEYVTRMAGSTAPLKHGEYHRIHAIHGSYALTLFITGKYRGPWGFLVDGVKIPWRTYVGLRDGEDLASAEVKECPQSPTGEHEVDFDDEHYLTCLYCGHKP